MSNSLKESPLGKKSSYDSPYNPSLLFPIPREGKRNQLPFRGADLWTCYELSWLNLKGKPYIGILDITVPCETPMIFESKSLKLYLVSLNQTRFANVEEVKKTIQKDLSHTAQGEVKVHIFRPEQFSRFAIQDLSGTCIDDLDIDVDCYTIDPSYLRTQGPVVEETLYSHLLKSNCMITSQPDWASVQIHYIGPKIDREGLLKYLISFRQHNEFHEPCVERIYLDVTRYCQPEKLTVNARFLRKGGSDINPFRSNWEPTPPNMRTSRQ